MVSATMGRAAATVALFAGSVVAHAQGPAVIPATGNLAPAAAALTAFIEREMTVQGIPALSIALVDDQRVVWSRGFGSEDAAGRRPATAQTVYRVGSVSKLFTDVAVMQLVEQGAISLDAPVQQYLRTFQPRNPFGTPITLRQLMSHHAGLVREPPVGHYFDDTAPTLAATVASLNGTTLVAAPGTRHKYSNAAIAVVGYLLERRSGVPFGEYLQQKVLRVLDMPSSAFAPTRTLAAHVPCAVMWNYQERPFDAPTFQLGMAPAGSMYATMPDLGRFISMLFRDGAGARGRVLKRETLRQMWVPQFAPAGATTGAGIGFGVGALDGETVVQHGGAIYGFATQLTAMPDAKLGVAVSAAKDGVNALTARIAREALRLMQAARAGKALPALEQSSVIPPALLARFTGEWVAGDSTLTIVARDTMLEVTGSVLETQLGVRRWRGDTLVVDDGLQFGQQLWLEGDALRLGDQRFRRKMQVSTLPPEVPLRWAGLVGEYGWDHDVLYILERDGRLHALIEWFFDYPLTEVSPDTYAFPQYGLYAGERIEFTRDGQRRATVARAAGIDFTRRSIVGEDGGVFRITPLKPVAELQAAALALLPPAEQGTFRPPELTELVTLDSTIHLDIRYASTRNFMSTPFYSQPRAFLQRPAAEALVRAHRALARQGYGLLIHDGYRPWYVTKMFWDGTPPDKHDFVADPSQGSRHNRGCAVDLTLYDLRTGEPVMMTGGYDEMSDRSYPDYPGGTSRQRALRAILRAAMEAEGFSVYSAEWWHFDYRDWRSYRIGNQRFEELGR